jgi:hypothetical protein
VERVDGGVNEADSMLFSRHSSPFMSNMDAGKRSKPCVCDNNSLAACKSGNSGDDRREADVAAGSFPLLHGLLGMPIAMVKAFGMLPF